MDTTDKDAILASYSTLGALLTMTTTAIESGQQASWNAITVSGSNILVVGYAQTSSGPQYIAMGEYNTGGTLVSTFGTNGIVQTDAGGSSVGSAILVASNSIWVAGNADMTAVLVQYSPSGAFDQIVRSTIRENATWNAMALAGSNILVAGYCNDGSMAIALSEYNVYGNLVSSFGVGGVVMTNVGTNATANAVMVETSGKILVTGTAQENYLHSNGSGYYQVELALVQYQSNGALDPTFGSDGVALPFVTSGATSDGYALATLSNGNVAVAGQIEDSSSGHDIFVTEYSVATTPASTYTYDVRNKMVGFSGATGTATYMYDDAGDRVEETVNGTATYYLIDTNNPTGYDQPIEQKSSPTATPSETYIIGDRVLGQADGSGTLTWLLVDGHGSTRLLTNASGTVTATLNYDASGNALNFNPATIGTIWQFGGDGYYDSASGLTFHSNGRQSSSIIGRFITEDDQVYMVKLDPITGNLYILDNADPVNGNDPSGHDDNELEDEAFDEADEDIAEDIGGYEAVDSALTSGVAQADGSENEAFNEISAEMSVYQGYAQAWQIGAQNVLFGAAGAFIGGALFAAVDEGGGAVVQEAQTLFHGTDAESALSIVENGLDLEAALEAGGDGSFWTTTAVEDAEQFAVVNPAGGSPAVIQVQVPAQLINNLIEEGLLTVKDSVYQFAAGAYDRLNEFATFLSQS